MEYIMERPYEELSEEEQVHLDARAEAQEFQQEEEKAKSEGYCIHCGDDLDSCTGYKCWIR
tara:strand:- start:2392 stop:2574 length:183 start_codon:yes stop_codon:yes gene_type:complete